MTQTTNETETNGKPSYRRTSDQLVSVQLIGTIAAIVFGFLGFQYQSGKIVSDIASKISSQDQKIENLTEDIKEIKEILKDINK